MILAAAALTAFAAPALADTVECTVNAPEIRLRKSPSKKAHVITILKKNARVTTNGACAGGWVKVTSENGRLSGYVGGWALSAAAPKVATVTPVHSEDAVADPAPSVDAPKQAATNEQLAIQITELRLNVLGIERNVERLDKEIQKIKVTVRHKMTARRHAAHAGKEHKNLAKKE